MYARSEGRCVPFVVLYWLDKLRAQRQTAAKPQGGREARGSVRAIWPMWRYRDTRSKTKHRRGNTNQAPASKPRVVIVCARNRRVDGR